MKSRLHYGPGVQERAGGRDHSGAVFAWSSAPLPYLFPKGKARRKPGLVVLSSVAGSVFDHSERVVPARDGWRPTSI